MTDSVVDYTDRPPTGRKAVLLVWAPWHEACTRGGPMDQVLRALATSSGNDNNNKNVLFGRIHADHCPALVELYQVTAVPTFVLLNSTGDVVERIEAADESQVAAVTRAVQRLLQMTTTETYSETATAVEASTTTTTAVTSPLDDDERAMKNRLERLIRSADTMLFLKGTPDVPRCGFSRQAVELLQDEQIAFGSFDILQDETVRQGLKQYSNWPTYPQLYHKGELVGGLDIMKEMQEEGGLRNQLGIADDDIAAATTNADTPPLSLNERLSQLVKRHKVMLFMKGLPSAPRCGFSRQIVEILQEENIPYDSFDILQDEQVRQGLKQYSDWPTYPQLYVNGELLGGLDIVQEMKQDGSLTDALGS